MSPARPRRKEASAQNVGKILVGTPSAPSKNPRWENYTNTNTVRGLAQEGSILWLGTTGGVVRWNLDERSYSVYSVWDGLGDNFVCAVAIDRSGAKWFGTNGGGLSRLDGRWKTWTTRDGLTSDYVSAVGVDPSGNVWAGTGSGLNRMEGDRFRSAARALKKLHVTSIAFDAAGTWAGTLGRGVALVSPRGCRFYTTSDGLPHDRVHAVCVDKSGTAWAGTLKGPAWFDGRRWRTVEADGRTVEDSIACMIADARGGLWCGTDGGLKLDEHGNKWFRSVGCGLLHFDGASWSRQRAADGLAHDNVLALFLEQGSRLWAGTGDGFCFLEGNRWSAFKTRADTLPDNSVISACIDASGRQWFGTSRKGLCCREGSIWRIFADEDGSPLNNVQALAFNDNGALWGGTGSGVFRLDDSGLEEFDSSDGLAADYVSSVAADSNGRVWFGTRGAGISVFNGRDWSRYDAQTTQGAFQGRVVRAIAVDDKGPIWFATTGQGAYRFDGRSWKNFSTRDGLPSDNVYSIAVDARGATWLGTDRGVSCLDGFEVSNTTSRIWTILSIFKSALLRRQWTALVRYLLSVRWHVTPNLAGDHVRALAVAPSGTLWVGALGGASRFDKTGWRKYTQTDGLCHYNVRCIAIDTDGSVWIATMGGVSRLLQSGSSD